MVQPEMLQVPITLDRCKALFITVPKLLGHSYLEQITDAVAFIVGLSFNSGLNFGVKCTFVTRDQPCNLVPALLIPYSIDLLKPYQLLDIRLFFSLACCVLPDKMEKTRPSCFI